MFRLRPVLPARWPGHKNLDWVFAGPPQKRYFDAPPEPLTRCLWHIPLEGWRQEARHNTSFLENRGDQLCQVFERLADEESRLTYASILRSRNEGDAGFVRIATYGEYDHPVVRARPGDVVIDAGAFNGDSAIRYAWRMLGRGTIISLEPDTTNFEKLQRRRIPGMRPLNVGAWNEKTTLSFDSDSACGRISADGPMKIKVDTIDAIVRQQSVTGVDLLKLDVEGAEAQALEGAANTLKQFRPKLQISIYHQPNDLFRLPIRLMESMPGYRWYVGHHCPWLTETDLYGIPDGHPDANAKLPTWRRALRRRSSNT